MRKWKSEKVNSVVASQNESSSMVRVIKYVENQQNDAGEEGQGRIKLKGKEKVGVDDEVRGGGGSYEPLVCHKCKGTGHMAKDCRTNWPLERGGR
jgi:hypothetical protein